MASVTIKSAPLLGLELRWDKPSDWERRENEPRPYATYGPDGRQIGRRHATEAGARRAFADIVRRRLSRGAAPPAEEIR